jgi:hypothetical protein
MLNKEITFLAAFGTFTGLVLGCFAPNPSLAQTLPKGWGLPSGIDPGADNFPRALVDVTGDGRADFCRFVGNPPNMFISCLLKLPNGQFDVANPNHVYTSINGVDPGYADRRRGFRDVNGDGRADYCRFVGNSPDIHEACHLGTTSEGFNANQFLTRWYGTPDGYSWKNFAVPIVSEDFTPAEREKIWRALDKAQSTLQNNKISSCIKKYVNLKTGEYSGEQPDFAVSAFLTRWPSQEGGKRPRTELVIRRYSKDDNTLGRASVGIIDSSTTKRNDFDIALNANQISDLDENTLAGVVVHEVLHNWGYRHTRYSASKEDEDRRGNFVYEAGWCVAREGNDKQPGSLSLTGDDGEFFVD